jgi:UDP-glucose 4-epimerase
MKVLVTGGAGFIGSHVVDAYIGAGHQVMIVDDLSTGRWQNLNPKAKFYKMSILDKKLETLLRREKIQAVNHHAAQIKVGASMENPPFDVKVNILGSVQLFESCRRAGVKKLIYASSGGAMYGEANQGPMNEKTPARPFSVYGASKLSVEHYLGVFAQNFGLKYVTLRYANVYGSRQDALGEGGVVAIFTYCMMNDGKFRIFGDGLYVRDYVYVKDVARANLLALHYPKNDAFNIGTGVKTTTNELFKKLAKASGYSKPAKHGPPRLGDLRKSVLDASRAKKLLKWKPRYDLAAGLKETVNYYKSYKF